MKERQTHKLLISWVKINNWNLTSTENPSLGYLIPSLYFQYHQHIHHFRRHSWYDKCTCAPARALQKMFPSRKTTFANLAPRCGWHFSKDFSHKNLLVQPISFDSQNKFKKPKHIWTSKIGLVHNVYFIKGITKMYWKHLFYIIPDATNTTGPDGQYWNPAPPPIQQHPPIQQQPLHQGTHARMWFVLNILESNGYYYVLLITYFFMKKPFYLFLKIQNHNALTVICILKPERIYNSHYDNGVPAMFTF